MPPESPSPLAQTRSYPVSPMRRAVMWIGLGPLLVMGLALWILGDESGRAAGVIVTLLMAAALAFWHWLLSRTRLELNADGVRLRQVAMHMQTTWDNIVAISTERGHEGFITKNPLAGKGATRLSGIREMGTYDSTQQEYMQQRRWIPIEPFGWYLRKRALARDICELAPHLAGELTPGKIHAKPPPVFATRRQAWTVIGIIVGSLAVGLIITLWFENWADSLFAIVLSICLPIFTLQLAQTAWIRAREKSWLAFWLYCLSALASLLFAITAWMSLAENFGHNTPSPAEQSATGQGTGG